MAINFPATGGQATDGSFTYTVAGIVYAWNGSSWAAAGAGASATDKSLFSVTTNSAGSAALSYNNNSGVFSYTPPDLSSYLTAEADTLATVTGRGNSTTQSIETTGSFKCQIGSGNQGFYLYNGASTHATFHWSSSASGNYFRGNASGNYPFIMQDFSYVSINPGTSGVNLSYGGSNKFSTTNTGATITGALTAGGLTYPTTNGNSGQSLVSDGAGNVTWQTASGLAARATVSSTSSLANDAVANVSITTPKTYVLLKVETSHAAWVTLYTDTSSRTADASRQISVDPIPGSGVLSEVITTGAQTQLITPGAICFNSVGTGTTYAKIVNKSGSTTNVQVTLTYVALEA